MLLVENFFFVYFFSVGCAVLNYSVYDKPLKMYFSSLMALASESEAASQKIGQVVEALSENHRSAFLKSIFRNSKLAEEVVPVLKSVPVEKLRMVFNKLLLSRTSFASTEVFSRVVCYLSLSLEPEIFVQNVLLPVMALWADPVIARAHVKAEVVHYSKLAVIIFSHLSRETVLRFQIAIVEKVRK